MGVEEEGRESSDNIEKKVKLNFDGRQFFVRIPKQISDFFELDKKEDYEAHLTVDVEKDISERIREMKLVIQEEEG